MSTTAIDPRRFPHIDLNERSARPGVDGPRYVSLPGQDCLGDTNNGLLVHPRTVAEEPQFEFSDMTQQHDAVEIVSGRST
jgi:hypothetical protein